jgi:hypothetical protein
VPLDHGEVKIRVEVEFLLDLLQRQEVCLLEEQCEFGDLPTQDYQVQEDLQGGGLALIQRFGTTQA